MKALTYKARTQLWIGVVAATLCVSGVALTGCSDDLGTTPGQNALDPVGGGEQNPGTPEAIIPVVDDGSEGGGTPSDPPSGSEDPSTPDTKNPNFESPPPEGDGATLIEGLDLGIPGLLPEDVPDFVGDVLDGVLIPGNLVTNVTPGLGGRLQHSIFTLDVPEQAVKADTQFELIVEEGDGVKVSLFPEGLQFERPVTLTMDLSQIVGFEGPDLTMYWWDPAAKEWVNIGGHWDRDARTLSIELWHFSDYSCGRAGWKGGPKKPVDTKTK